jgi:hypothetical protein
VALETLVDPQWTQDVAAALAQQMPELGIVTDLDCIDPSNSLASRPGRSRRERSPGCADCMGRRPAI